MLRRHWPDIRWGLAIFALAFVLRVAFVSWIDPDPRVGARDDSWFYYHSARALVEGKGYIFPGLGGAPTAYWPPGYSALLATVYLLPGPDLLAGKLLNAFLGAAGAVLAFAIGRMTWSRPVGVAGGLLLTLLPSHVFYSTVLLTDLAYATLLTGVLLLFALALTRGPSTGAMPPVLVGLALGVATMFRGEGVLLPVLFGLVWWLSSRAFKQGVRFAALSFLGVAVVLGGWTIRNVIQLDALVPINTGNSVVLALSHWEGADGGGNRARSRYLSSYYQELPYPEREVKAAQKRTREALTYMVTHPAAELSLIPRRLFELYRHDHDAVDWIAHNERLGSGTMRTLRALSDAYYFVLLAVALFGSVLWWRVRREVVVLLMGMVVYVSAVIGLLFFGDQRYHASIMPAISLLAAPAVMALRDTAAEALRKRSFKPFWQVIPDGQEAKVAGADRKPRPW